MKLRTEVSRYKGQQLTYWLKMEVRYMFQHKESKACPMQIRGNLSKRRQKKSDKTITILKGILCVETKPAS